MAPMDTIPHQFLVDDIYIYPHSGYLSPPFHQFHVVSIYIYTVYIYITIQFLRNHEGIMVLAFYDTPLFLL